MKRFTMRAALVVLAFTAPVLTAGAAAPAGRYTTNGGTVTDTKTKLVWQEPFAPMQMTLADAKTYCPGLKATLGGTGWRLPTIKELRTLVDVSVSTGPAIDATYFPNMPVGGFLSSTIPANSPSSVWILLFDGGGEGESSMSNTYNIRCVR